MLIVDDLEELEFTFKKIQLNARHLFWDSGTINYAPYGKGYNILSLSYQNHLSSLYSNYQKH